MARTGILVGFTQSGDCVDAYTGKKLDCAVHGDVSPLLARYKELAESGGVIAKGKTGLQLKELRLIANHTTGGELKAPRRFKA